MRYTTNKKGVGVLKPYTQKIQYYLRRIGRVKTWQLVVIGLLMLLVSATFLRLNNLGMVERRTAVIAADESGDKEQIKQSLVDLQRFISSHMNTSLNGGLYLSKSYERDRAAALEAASGASNPQAAVYQQASIECRSRFQGGVESFRNDYVQCVVERVNALSPSTDPAAGAKLPKADTYRYDFSPPLWSFDAAGISVLITGVIALIIVVRVLTALVLSVVIRRGSQPF